MSKAEEGQSLAAMAMTMVRRGTSTSTTPRNQIGPSLGLLVFASLGISGKNMVMHTW
jgi:hypothetical protein